MYITILTLFPTMFRGPFDESIIKRAQKQGSVTITIIDIRNFATDKHKSVDEHPYGGGPGMILRVDVLDRAITYAKSLHPKNDTKVILIDPTGKPYRQHDARRLAQTDLHCILVCGHYEGVDERIRALVDEEISIGDYVLTCGEIPAMVLVDSIVRLLPHVLKKETATIDESFSSDTGFLEYPQYTKPSIYNNDAVPSILLSGDHKRISLWKQQQALNKTQTKRPDILKKIPQLH